MTIKEVSKKYNISEDTLRYYEKVGMLPAVTRGSNGFRDYQKQDLDWVELAICMRGAGLPVDAMITYVKLFKQGNGTIVERLNLLKNQRMELINQKEQIDKMLNKLNYKISRYEVASKTGKLTWN